MSFWNLNYNFDGILTIEGSDSSLFNTNGHVVDLDNYLKSTEETELTMTLNYFIFARIEINLLLPGVGEKALNSLGLYTYQNNKKYFVFLCGNQFIRSYQKGAFLIMGIKLAFQSSEDKISFMKSAKESLHSNISKAAQILSETASKTKIKVDPSIKAYQFAGDIHEFIDFKFNTSLVYINNVLNWENLIKHTKEMYRYATGFPSQLKNETEAYGSLGIKKTSLIPIENLYLNWTSSVTEDIKISRSKLVDTLKVNEFYKQKLNSLITKANQSNQSEILINLLKKVDKNIEILKSSSSDAFQCWHVIEKCPEVTKNIDEKIYKLTPEDLKILKLIL